MAYIRDAKQIVRIAGDELHIRSILGKEFRVLVMHNPTVYVMNTDDWKMVLSQGDIINRATWFWLIEGDIDIWTTDIATFKLLNRTDAG